MIDQTESLLSVFFGSMQVAFFGLKFGEKESLKTTCREIGIETFDIVKLITVNEIHPSPVLISMVKSSPDFGCFAIDSKGKLH